MNKKDKRYDVTAGPFLRGLVVEDRHNEIVRSIIGVVGPLLLLLIFIRIMRNSLQRDSIKNVVYTYSNYLNIYIT